MLYLVRNKETQRVVIRTESFYNASLWYRKMPNKEKYEVVVLKRKKA